MANEFVTKKFLDAAGVKVLWDEIGLEIAAEAKAREDAVKTEEEARIAADNALDTKITTLSGVVTAVSSKADQNATDIDTLEGKVAALEAGTYDDTEVRGLIAGNTQAIADEKTRAEAAEAKALEDAKAYTDEVKASILGEDLTETYDTLKEIADWIEGSGVDATDLSTAIAAEAKAREEADTALDGRIAVLEAIDVATKDDVATAKSEAATDAQSKADAALAAAKEDATAKANAAQTAAEATAAADATTKANAAEAAAKAHAEEKATAAKDAAIAAAALDATAKADQAELDAIAAAALDATNKANTAEANAKAYADGLAGNYDAAGSAAAAETAAKSYADAEAAKAYAAIDALSAAEIRKAIGRTTE